MQKTFVYLQTILEGSHSNFTPAITQTDKLSNFSTQIICLKIQETNSWNESLSYELCL